MADDTTLFPPSPAGLILHARAPQHYWRGQASLSVKSFIAGSAVYRVGDAYFGVGEGEYLLLNSGQEYSIVVDAETPVESFCVFFDPDFAKTVQSHLTAPPARLLDDPGLQVGAPVEFFERTYPHDDVVSPVLTRMRSLHTHHGGDAAWLQEGLHELMAQLLRLHGTVLRETERVSALRASTREELYRRLHLAKEYVTVCFDQPITLDQIARVAGLSPNHLLRTFRSLFGQTPYQYLVAQRIERARALLTTSDIPITEICFAVGWKSPGSFSFLFHRQTGLSPRAYRRQFGDFQEVPDGVEPQ